MITGLVSDGAGRVAGKVVGGGVGVWEGVVVAGEGRRRLCTRVIHFLSLPEPFIYNT